MKQEDKELLLRDLCGRFPYGVKCQFEDAVETITEIWFCEDEGWQIDGEKTSTCIHAVKPYLFPLSSMTEEQKEEYCQLQQRIIYNSKGLVNTDIMNYASWCYKNHLDVNGLILLGSAIDATGLNIY